MSGIGTCLASIALALTTAAAATGCATPNEPYRLMSDVPCIPDTDGPTCSKTFLEPLDVPADPNLQEAPAGTTGPVIAYIEFDDQGQMFRRESAHQALGEIRQIAARQKVTIVLFVHGWKHNASTDDSNVRSFQKLLRETHSFVNAGQDDPSSRRRIIGVYVGWRGLSARHEPFRTLSFWSRKDTSAAIGGEGLVEVVSELANIRRHYPRNVAVALSGHSFGGQMLFHSVKHLLLDELISKQYRNGLPSTATKGDGAYRSSIADLTFLVNPAIESLRYVTLVNRAAMARFDQHQKPIFAVFMSEADNATAKLFPLGRSFSTMFESYRDVRVPESSYPNHLDKVAIDVNQRDLDRVALGHHPLFITHELTKLDFPVLKQRIGINACMDWKRYIKQEAMRDFWTTDGLKLERRRSPGYDPHNPYMVVRVEKGIIRGHNDIWRPDFRTFIARLIQFSALDLTCSSSADDNPLMRGE